MSFREDLESLETAEDFFEYLGVEAEPRAVRVNRLHILKRFHDLLEEAGGLDDPDDATGFARARDALSRAHASVLATDQTERKLFRVHHLQEERAAAAFVPLGAIRGLAAR